MQIVHPINQLTIEPSSAAPQEPIIPCIFLCNVRRCVKHLIAPDAVAIAKNGGNLT